MKKFIYLLYAVICYGIFFATFLYLIGYVENITDLSLSESFSRLFPKTLGTGTSSLAVLFAIVTDLFLIALFGVQHSVMARPAFKKKWTKIVPRPIERSTYVLFASIMLIIMMYFWQPVKFVLWDVSQSVAGSIFLILSIMGWGIILLSTFLINHFDLFGLRQVYLYARNEKIGHIKFRTPLFYKVVRHPLYFGFLLAFWFVPVMTVGQLVFTVGMTTYIFIGIYHEEKDLVKSFGNQYADYRERIPKIIPFTKTGKIYEPQPHKETISQIN